MLTRQMRIMRIERTESMPAIFHDVETNIITIRGKSMPDDASALYEPVRELIRALRPDAPKFVMDIKLQYFNTGSAKQLFETFKELQRSMEKGVDVKVIWRYDQDDGDLAESGIDFKEMLHLPFELVPEHPDREMP